MPSPPARLLKKMTDLSNKSCVVLDHGMFLEVAHRLSRDFGKVYYVDPSHEECMPTIDHAVIGDGFDNIERISEIWDVIEKVDLCVFPDVHHGAMQKHIADMGIPVWGGRKADELEVKKVLFRAIQRQQGMNTPTYTVIIGLDELRKFCRSSENDDCWIKISPQYRGNRETFHHTDYLSSREILDAMGVDFGIVQDEIKFIAEETIKAAFEGGMDTYCVDGKHPATVLQAYERKDRCCLGAVQKWNECPTQLTANGDVVFALMKKYGAAQFVSTEIKITESGESYLLEPTIRMASPAGEPQLELYENFSEIIYEGARGNLIEPKWAGKFYAQVMVEHNGCPEKWRSIQIPDDIRQWVKLYNACMVGNRYGLAPMDKTIGSIIGIGDTMGQALEHVTSIADQLSDQPVKIQLEDMADTLAQISEAEEAGLKFSDEPVPKPEEAMKQG